MIDKLERVDKRLDNDKTVDQAFPHTSPTASMAIVPVLNELGHLCRYCVFNNGINAYHPRMKNRCIFV